MDVSATIVSLIAVLGGFFSPEPQTVYNPIETPVEYTQQFTAPPASHPVASFQTISETNVLGESIEMSLKPTLSPTTKPKDKPIRRTKKGTITITLLGDSMMDTMGPNAPQISRALQIMYPQTNFIIKNAGVGGVGILPGIERITNGYTYLGENKPSVSSIQPDVVVLESFAYNPMGDDASAITTHWMNLARAVDAIKANLPQSKIVMAVTIAPNRDRFGDNAPGIAFDAADKVRRTDTIKKHLENAIRFAQGEHLPLANAYHASMDGSGNGKLTYINPSDHIHYSEAGRVLMGNKIAEAIAASKIIE